MTNAVRCRPLDNRTPSKKEITTCTGLYLSGELEAVGPVYGLALGNVGLQATLGKKGITKYNGEVFEAHGIKWVAGFHPAAVLRNPRYSSDFDAALLVFSRLVKDEIGAPTTNSVAVTTKELLKDLINRLDQTEEAAIDVESWGRKGKHGRFPGGGLAWWTRDTHEFRLASINFTFKVGTSFVLPLWHKESPWKSPESVLQVLKPYIEQVPYWVMQNGKFDEKCLAMFGIFIHQDFDTMGAQYALDENNRKDLGFLAKVYLSAPDYKDTVDKSDTYSAPLDDLVEYGGQDTDYTFRLGKVLKNRLQEQPLAKRLFDTLLMPAANVLSVVEVAGLPIHRGKFKARWERAINERDGVLHQIREMAPPIMANMNPNSPQQLGNLLYNHMDFPILESTKAGNPSTAESVLIRLKDVDDSGIINLILQYRHWNGYLSRYFVAWDYYMDEHGRMHPNFKPFHTVTGRLSASNPNVQQIARDPFIRGIVGGRKGWTFVEVDYSQVELRVVAHVSQDKTMLRAYNTGRDLHMETAMAITGKREQDISSEERKKAKSVNFGFLYGMGWRKYMEYAKTNFDLDVLEAEAKDVRKTFFDTYRGIYPWHDRQRKAANRRGWVISPIGRKRHLHDIRSTNQSIRAEAERQAINSPIQSMASDMMLLSMVQLHQVLDPYVARMVSTVHDSILFEIRDDAVEDLIPVIRKTMEDLPLEELFDTVLTVPIKVDFKIGRFWSEGATEL